VLNYPSLTVVALFDESHIFFVMRAIFLIFRIYDLRKGAFAPKIDTVRNKKNSNGINAR